MGRDAEDGIRAAHLAGSVGITTVGGYLDGGMTIWREERRSTGRVGRIDVPGLHERMHDGPAIQVLDVRERAEWDRGHIPGSISTPYHDIGSVPEGLDPAGPIAVICSSGERSGVAASLLVRQAHSRSCTSSTAASGPGARGWPVEVTGSQSQ